MKKIFLLLLLISTTPPALCEVSYSAMYGNRGYRSSSYSSSGYGTSSYSSAASSAARYNASHSSYNSYRGSRNGSYSSSSNSNYSSSSRPNYNSSYGSSYARSAVNRSYRPSSAYNSTLGASRKSSLNEGVKVVPFRYNTLDYTRVRKMEADPPKQFSAKCTDMGDASFCQ